MPGAFFRAILLTGGGTIRPDGQPAKTTLLEAHRAEVALRTTARNRDTDWIRPVSPAAPEGRSLQERK